MCSDLDRPDEALASYDKALALKPDYAEALNNRGNASDLKRPEEALASYDKALALKPDYAEALNNRGNALQGPRAPRRGAGQLRQGARAQAGLCRGAQQPRQCARPTSSAPRRRWRASTERSRSGPTMPRRSTTAAMCSRPQAPEEALASYDKALALKPDYAEALNNRGNALMTSSAPQEALASYDRALALKPDYAEAFNNRGNALKELKRPEEALASYDKALALKPGLCRGL